MDAGNVAFAAFRSRQATRAADVQGLDLQALGAQSANDSIEADTMAADDYEGGKRARPGDDLNSDGRSDGHTFFVAIDGEEAVGLAEGCDRARSFGDRIGDERILGLAADQ